MLETGAPAVPRTEVQTQIRNVTIRDTQNSSVGSRTDGKNSDIGDLADFSSDEEEPQMEQISGCRIPGCRCEEGIGNMKWNYDDLSDSEDSEWEDPGQRSIRLENRRKGYENNAQYTPEMLEEIRRINEMGI